MTLPVVFSLRVFASAALLSMAAGAHAQTPIKLKIADSFPVGHYLPRYMIQPMIERLKPIFGNGQGALHNLGLFDGDLPIPVLHGPGEIEILPFLRHLDLRLRPRQFGLLKLGVLFVDHEAAQQLERPGEDELLLRIEEMQIRDNGYGPCC